MYAIEDLIKFWKQEIEIYEKLVKELGDFKDEPFRKSSQDYLNKIKETIRQLKYLQKNK